MKFFIPIIIFSFLFSAQVTGIELITNGDFEEQLTTGWEQATSGADIIINRATSYDPDPDYEAYAYKGTGSGYARLLQLMNVIPSTDIDFTCNAKLYAWDNYIDAWAGAAVVISYLNENSLLLGETYICFRSDGCPWTNTPTCHIIAAVDSFWHNYAFNIDDELTNLSGVNPQDIKKIKVSLYSEGHWC